MTMISDRPETNPDHDLTYRDTHLGIFSSHPYWLERWSLIFRRFVLATMVGIYLLVLYVWLRGSTMSSTLSAFFEWARLGMGLGIASVAALVLGMLTAASFQLRLAAYKSTRQEHRSKDNMDFSPAMIIACAIGGIGLPILLTIVPGMPFELRVFGSLLAILPAATLSYLLPASGPKQRFPYWWIILLVPLASVGSFFTGAAVWFYERSPRWVGEFLPVLQTVEGWRNAGGAIGIAVVALFLFRVAGWWRTRHLPAEDGVLKKIYRSIRSWFKKKRSSKSGSDDKEVVEQSDDHFLSPKPLQEWLSKRGCIAEPIKSISPGMEETTDWSSDTKYHLFFGGHCPTIDQWRVLDNFLWLHQHLLDQGKQETPSCGFELVLEGPSGAGKSATLDALALLSLMAGGMRSAYFVADEGRIEIVRDRLQKTLSQMGLDSFIRIGTVADIDISSVDLDCPDILVTTPALWEESLPGQVVPSNSSEADAVRHIMLGYAAIFLDDWMEHPVEVRAHLPFLLDKHRLLLESEAIPRACVVVFPSLTGAGRKMAMDRIIGHEGVVDEKRQWHTLRYRPMSAVDVLDIRVESIDETLDALFEDLAQEQVDVILLRKGIDHEEAATQTEQIRLKHHNAAVTVCYCDDQLAAFEGPASAILMKAVADSETALALRSRRPDDALLVLRLSSPNELPAPAKLTPLILERSGRGLAESHLYNILRFIEPRAPAPHRVWGQLGLEAHGSPSLRKARDAKGGLRLDLPPPHEEGAHYLQRLGGYVALDERFRALEICDLHWIPEPGEPPLRITGDAKEADLLVLGNTDHEQRRPQPVVEWFGNEGTELGKSQLHHQQELVLRRRRVFAPNSVRRTGDGPFIFEASPYEGNGTDLIHQKFNLSWSFPPKSDNAESSLESGFGGPAHGYVWLSNKAMGQITIQCEWSERTDNLDRPSLVGPYEFQYQASVSTLLLAPNNRILETPHEFREALSAVFSPDTKWSSEHPDFLPGLTYALTRAIEASLPSAGFFGKFLTFRLQGQAAQFASALVCIVEPHGVGGTLPTAIGHLLREPAFMTKLAGQLDAVLRQGWEHSPLSELASFWLPHRLRRPVSLFERRLAAELAQSDTKLTPTGEEVHHDWHFNCPDCGEIVDGKTTWGNGLQTFTHCERTVMMLTSTSDKKMIDPRQLVVPWWPDDLSRPSGSKEDIVRFVWRAVAERVVYILDHKQIDGASDCWYSPQEVWERQLGDCEDHAILMLAMLADFGIMAWLVWGDAGGGHAWVEAEIEGRHFLIEATAKTVPENIPTIEEAEKHYQETYVPETKYPGRCNQDGYGIFDGTEWKPIELALASPGKSHLLRST